MENRVIKFRAWDEINKEMVYEKPLPECFGLLKSGDILNRYEDVMQFTGLTDKNGKEIYKGDIVKSQGLTDWYSLGDIQFSHGVFGIEWFHAKKSKSMVGGWGQLHNLRTMDDDIIERIEVIGNIYQNTELLTPTTETIGTLITEPG